MLCLVVSFIVASSKGTNLCLQSLAMSTKQNMLHAERSRPEAMIKVCTQNSKMARPKCEVSAPDQSLLISNDNKKLITHNIHYTTLSLFIQKQTKSTFRNRVEKATRLLVHPLEAHTLTSMKWGHSFADLDQQRSCVAGPQSTGSTPMALALKEAQHE